MEDEKTKNNLACAAILKRYRIKTTVSALGEQEKKLPKQENYKKAIDEVKNPNRTLFSPESLREHHVPGYELEMENTDILEEIIDKVEELEI